MNYSKIGEHLRLIRERKGLSYEQIFEITKIQPSILQGIEEGQSPVSPVFLKGFIKTYTRSLGLDSKVLFQFIERENEKKDATKKEVKAKNKNACKNKKRNYLKYLLLLFGLTIVFSAFWFVDISTKNNERNVITGKNQKNYLKEGSIENATAETQKDTATENPVSSTAETQKDTTTENQNEDKLEANQTLFRQIKKSVFKKDILIKSTEPLEIYFKVDKRTTITKRLDPFLWFHIKAKESIYLRFDEKQGNIQIFYNGKQVDTGNKRFFEKTFQ